MSTADILQLLPTLTQEQLEEIIAAAAMHIAEKNAPEEPSYSEKIAAIRSLRGIIPPDTTLEMIRNERLARYREGIA